MVMTSFAAASPVALNELNVDLHLVAVEVEVSNLYYLLGVASRDCAGRQLWVVKLSDFVLYYYQCISRPS